MAHNRTTNGSWPVDEVAQVLQRRLDMSEEDAQETADQLASIFDGKETIEDTEVESQERSFLWSLLLEGIVTVETQRRPHPDHGKMWRYFYWHLVPPERLREREETDEEDQTVYDNLPSDVWSRTGSAAA